MVWEGYHQQQPFKHRPNWYHIKKRQNKTGLCTSAWEKGHRAPTEVRSISRSAPRTTGETGPVKQWWRIYTASFASITLSAVKMTASVLRLNNKLDSNSINRINNWSTTLTDLLHIALLSSDISPRTPPYIHYRWQQISKDSPSGSWGQSSYEKVTGRFSWRRKSNRKSGRPSGRLETCCACYSRRSCVNKRREETVKLEGTQVSKQRHCDLVEGEFM